MCWYRHSAAWRTRPRHAGVSVQSRSLSDVGAFLAIEQARRCHLSRYAVYIQVQDCLCDLQACLISLLTIPHASPTQLLSRIGVLAVARCTDPVTELSLLYGRKTTTVPRYLERLGVFISSQLAGIPAKAYQLSTTWPMYEFADAGHRCSCTAPDSVCELISWAILWYCFPN